MMPTTPVAATAMAPAISARLHLDQLANSGPRRAVRGSTGHQIWMGRVIARAPPRSVGQMTGVIATFGPAKVVFGPRVVGDHIKLATVA